MKKLLTKLVQAGWIMAALCSLLPSQLMAREQQHYVSTDYRDGSFVIAKDNQVAGIYVDNQDYKGVVRAVSNLHDDIFKVTGKQGRVVTEPVAAASMIIVGTLGHSRLIDGLVTAGKIDVSGIRDQWEAFRIQTVDHPVAGIEQALVIVGSDKRGSIFGVYDLSEKIGVSPWYWWADVAIKKHQQLFVRKDTLVEDQPKVRYRGIFLNDEAPALTGWVKEKFGDYNSQFYEHVFELLLRLKANFLWPAMWNNAFSLDDPNNSVLADEMGIVMSNSHHEPMMRADKEWDRVGKGKWDYAVNKDNLYQFWQQGAQRHKNLDSVFTLGMRGQQDTPMSETENIDLLEEIVADQRQILKETFSDRDISEVPQVWTLYKEVQGYYEKGMRVPDDVTLLWSDDNWGNIRRLPTPEERKRSGGAGVYYHFDYVGGPRSYRWINSTQISKVWEQMNLAYRYNARQIWITNVGDLKPMEFPTDFFLRLAWDPERWPKEKLQEFGQQWAAQQFGSQYAEQIEHLLTAYTRHNARRKPELLDENTYSQLHYNEAERISAELQGLLSEAESLYRKIPAENQSAFFQLVLHPIKANSILFELYNSVAKNRLYARQGRASTNQYAELARQKFAEDAELTQQYHQLEDGRWNHFMDQTHIGYTHWNNPPANAMPYVAENQPADVADMGVAVEGRVDAWPQTGTLKLDTFSPYGQAKRFIDIYNKGTRSFQFAATASAPWIKISKSKGNVLVEQRLWISIDWQQAPQGNLSGTVLIKGTGWGGATVNISAVNPEHKPEQGFIEADGYVSIEAASGKALNSHDGSGWQEIPLYGRTQSAMSSFAPLDKRFTDPQNAPYLEYDVYLFNPQQLQVHTLVAPTLNFVPGQGLRVAIGFDDQQPQVIDILADNQHKDWQQAVSNNIRTVLTEHQLKQPGAHKLKVFMLDPAVVIQKIIIDTGGLQPSYLGPPPSRYLP